MQNNAQKKVDKPFIKAGDLQRAIFEIRMDEPEITPAETANALLRWFQRPKNEAVRLEVLKYAISHMWSVVSAKIDEDAIRGKVTVERRAHVAGLVLHDRRVLSVSETRKQQVAEAADKAVEQIVSTLKLMTFKQARMLYGAMADLDLTRGSDDQLLGDVFSDAEIRKAVG